MGPIWQAQLGESLVICSLAPVWLPNSLPYWEPNLGPIIIGKEDVCPNFALTVGKFVFSNSGNFRAKANTPKPRSCPKRPCIRAINGHNSSADWGGFSISIVRCLELRRGDVWGRG